MVAWPRVREFLDADLVDTMHVAVAPVELGRGGKLWDSPDELLDRFHHERGPEPERRHPPPLLAPLTPSRRLRFVTVVSRAHGAWSTVMPCRMAACRASALMSDRRLNLMQ